MMFDDEYWDAVDIQRYRLEVPTEYHFKIDTSNMTATNYRGTSVLGRVVHLAKAGLSMMGNMNWDLTVLGSNGGVYRGTFVPDLGPWACLTLTDALPACDNVIPLRRYNRRQSCISPG